MIWFSAARRKHSTRVKLPIIGVCCSSNWSLLKHLQNLILAMSNIVSRKDFVAMVLLVMAILEDSPVRIIRVTFPSVSFEVIVHIFNHSSIATIRDCVAIYNLLFREWHLLSCLHKENCLSRGWRCESIAWPTILLVFHRRDIWLLSPINRISKWLKRFFLWVLQCWSFHFQFQESLVFLFRIITKFVDSKCRVWSISV